MDTLREVRPTRFIGVPRVYEKIHEKLLEIGKQNNGLTRLVSDWAKRQAFEHHSRVMQGSNKISFQYYLARKLIFSKVRILITCGRALELPAFLDIMISSGHSSCFRNGSGSTPLSLLYSAACEAGPGPGCGPAEGRTLLRRLAALSHHGRLLLLAGPSRNGHTNIFVVINYSPVSMTGDGAAGLHRDHGAAVRLLAGSRHAARQRGPQLPAGGDQDQLPGRRR